MKHGLYFLMGLLLMISISLLQSCTTEDPEPDEDSLLVSTWSLGTGSYIKQHGVDKTANYAGLSVTFREDGTYTTQNGGMLFYPSGTWAWDGDNRILLDGDFLVEILSLTPDRLHVSFQMDADHVNTSGKIQSIVGEYEILF